MDYTSGTWATQDYQADECVVAAPEEPSPTALTGADPALEKLARKLEACDAVDDADARRRFVAKHASASGLSVAVVLARLRVAGALTADEVRDWEGKGREGKGRDELVIVLTPDLPPAGLRQEVRTPAATTQQVAVSSLHQVPAGGGEKLRALLASRKLSRLASLLEERGFVHGEWFADYAHAVLSPHSGCSSEPALYLPCISPESPLHLQVLSPHSGCNSEPAWVAWAMRRAAWPPEAGELLVLLSAQDKTAARRGLMALELARANTVRVIAWPRAWLPLLECVACELRREFTLIGEAASAQGEGGEGAGEGGAGAGGAGAGGDGEPAGASGGGGRCERGGAGGEGGDEGAERGGAGGEGGEGDEEGGEGSDGKGRCAQQSAIPIAARHAGVGAGLPAAPNERWVRLSVPPEHAPPAAATAQGAEAAAARSEAAMSVLRDLSRRLRRGDPESRVEAAPDGATGRFVINSVSYKSRVLRWVGKVDGDTDVFALQHMIQRNLAACC